MSLELIIITKIPPRDICKKKYKKSAPQPERFVSSVFFPHGADQAGQQKEGDAYCEPEHSRGLLKLYVQSECSGDTEK